MAAQYLTIIFILHIFCSRYSAVKLQQPAALAALVGSTTNISCQLQLSTEKVIRVTLYWFKIEAKTTRRVYVFPGTDPNSIISKQSARPSNPNHTTDMSLTIDNLRLAYTETYFCFTSLLIGSDSRSSVGDGTYVLVYENLKAYTNGTDLICEIEVYKVEHVTLVLEYAGRQYKDSVHGLLPKPSNSYWIANRLYSGTTQCQAQQNVTFSCLLQYKGESLLYHTIDVTCAGGFNSSRRQGDPVAPHPVLLYSLLLGNSLVILIIVLLFFLLAKMRERKRRNNVTMPESAISKYHKFRQPKEKLQFFKDLN
ncbi:uncharacterized protein LOC134965871 [Pseudophryne corroboree]|uniref:uncharacterized protein LOC134965871 n=1 Tax=Pseudophryne corroboree TaxID=495146 RepID=UPI00308198B1